LFVHPSGRADFATEKAEAGSTIENAARTSRRTDGTSDFIYKIWGSEKPHIYQQLKKIPSFILLSFSSFLKL
jgi:hypothetical protein